jgi:hypothetical protein
MNKLQKIEREMENHRATNCADCRRSVTSVTAPTCPTMLELNREARAASRKAKR